MTNFEDNIVLLETIDYLETEESRAYEFFDYKSCPRCGLNSMIDNIVNYYCSSCELLVEASCKSKQRIGNGVLNKFIHFKNVQKRLLTKNCDTEIIETMKDIIKENNMSMSEVDSNFIGEKLKINNIIKTKDYKLVYEILSQLNENYIENLDPETLDQIFEIFLNLVLYFIEKTKRRGKNGGTINYNFFLHKIFQSININNYLKPQSVKNPSRMNNNQSIWEGFVRHHNQIVSKNYEKDAPKFYKDNKYVFDNKFDTPPGFVV